MNAPSNSIGHQTDPNGGNWWHSWRIFPAIYAGLGVVILVARAADGEVASGLFWFGVMALIGAVYAFGGRIDLIRQARGDLVDEREASINTQAMAATGTVLVVVLIGCMVYELARGNNPSPYSTIMALGGATYVAALLIGRYRS